MNYLEYINQKIEGLKAQISELEAAKRIIEQVDRAMEKEKLKTLKTPATPRPTKLNASAKTELRRMVLDRLKEGPATSADIINEFGLAGGTKSEKQTIYQALYDLKVQGLASKNPDLIYSLVENYHETA